MNESFSPSEPKPDEKIVAKEQAEKDGGKSGGTPAPTRAELQAKLDSFYVTLEKARATSKAETTPKARETEEVIRDIDIRFNEFVDRYRVQNKIVPEFDEAKAAQFNENIDDFLQRLEKPVATKEKTETPAVRSDSLAALGIDAPNKEDLKQAIEMYGEQAIADIASSIQTLSSIPAPIHRELFGVDPLPAGKTADSMKIAVLILSRKLESSPYAYLLKDPIASIKSVQETARLRSTEMNDKLSRLRQEEQGLIKSLAQETGESSYDFLDTFTSKTTFANKSIEQTVKRIKTVRGNAEKLSTEKQSVDAVVVRLDIALRTGEAEKIRVSGKPDDADRKLLTLLEEYGSNLKDIDPKAAVSADKAVKNLRDAGKLSETEKAIFFTDPRSPEALAKAIEAKAAASPEGDILDQVRGRQTFTVGSFKTFQESYPNLKEVYSKDGVRTVTPALNGSLITTLGYPDGRSVTVLATAQAKRILEKIPDGMQPVLTKPVTSLAFSRAGGRGVQIKLLASLSDVTITENDIAFADRSGTLVQNDGNTPIGPQDAPTSAVIDSQLTNERGFRTENYAPRYPLKSLAGKPYPYALKTIRTQSGVTIEGVTVEKGVDELLKARPPKGKTLVLKRIPRSILLRPVEYEAAGRLSRPYQNVIAVDMLKKSDLAYANEEKDALVTSGLDGKGEKRTQTAQIEAEQNEKTTDIQRVLDRNPAIHGVKRAASTVQQTAGNLQKFLEASRKGSARQAFVEFAREEAAPTLKLLQSQETLRDVQEARRTLNLLKESGGVALGAQEKIIDEQLRALDQFTAMLQDGRTVNLLKTIMDASMFDEDGWNTFFTNQLPIIVGSIIVACAAAALVVASFGTAAPFIAVAAATAAGGIVGAELAKETVYIARQNLDSRVTSGKATFSARSKIGAYAGGQKVFNEVTGKSEDLEFFRDVASPYAQEFAVGFATTLATLGLGSKLGAGLSSLLQKTAIVEKLAERSGIMQIVARRLAQANTNKEVLERATGLKQALERALKELPKEVVEELSEEAQQQTLEKFLNQIDIALSASDGPNGKIGLGTVAGVLLATAKATRIGKKSIGYDVIGKATKESIRARADAIRSEATAQGAEVSDLGEGVLSVRYAVKGEKGEVQYETVQFLPPSIDVTVGPETRIPDGLVKKNTLDPSLDTGRREQLRADTIREYEANPSVQKARQTLTTLVETTFDGPKADALTALIDQASGLYINPDQYHSADHMLKMTGDAVELAKLGKLTPEAMETLVVAALYHDAGNGTNPDVVAGKDEVQAAEAFLRDVKDAKEGSYLKSLTPEAKTQVVADILATVFRDRHADAAFLQNLPTDATKNQTDYVQLGVDLLKANGILVTKADLTARMTSPESEVLRNADLAGSLKPVNVLKNNFTNYHEDTLKAPGAFRGKDIKQYSDGFGLFLNGTFTTGDKTLPLKQQAANGEVFVDSTAKEGESTDIQKRGKQLRAESKQTLEEYVQYDGPILNAMQSLISAENDPVKADRKNILALPMTELGPLLEQIIGPKAFDAYREAFEAAGTKTIATMSSAEVNRVFGAETNRSLRNVAVLGDQHIGSNSSDGELAINRFNAASSKLRQLNEDGQGVASIVDQGDFFDQVGVLTVGKEALEFKRVAETTARFRRELADAAGVKPENYLIVTGNHDIPETAVLQEGKRVLVEKLKRNAFTEESAAKATDDPVVQKKLVEGKVPTDAEVDAIIAAHPELERKFAQLEYSEENLRIWKEAHEKYGLKLVTTDPDEEAIVRLPGEDFDTVLRHLPVNDGGNMRSLVNEKRDGGKLRLRKRSGTVGRQIGSDIHTPGDIRGENWESGIPFQTLMTPALGGKTDVAADGDVSNGFILLGKDQNIRFLKFEKGTSNFDESKSIPVTKGASKPENTPPGKKEAA